jgi:hypothetical protein
VTALPDLPGYVHGIVSVDPPKVQCDECGLIASGESLNMLILTAGFTFHRSQPGRRLCRDCWAAVGVTA